MNKRMRFDTTLLYGKPLNNLLLPKGYELFKQLVDNIKAKNENR